MNQQPRKPRTLTFPTALTDLYGTRLRIQLRKLQNYFEDYTFTRAEIRTLGIMTIEESYNELTDKIRDYVTKRNLSFDESAKKQLQKTLDETLESWKDIVSDM